MDLVTKFLDCQIVKKKLKLIEKLFTSKNGKYQQKINEIFSKMVRKTDKDLAFLNDPK